MDFGILATFVVWVVLAFSMGFGILILIPACAGLDLIISGVLETGLWWFMLVDSSGWVC